MRSGRAFASALPDISTCIRSVLACCQAANILQAKIEKRNKELRNIVDRACEKESASKSQHNLRPLHVLDLKKAPLQRINLTEEYVLARGPDPDSESPIVNERCAPSHSGSIHSQKAAKAGSEGSLQKQQVKDDNTGTS